MTEERIPHKDPPPISGFGQEVTINPEGGWIAVTRQTQKKTDKNEKNDCDYCFTGPGGGINHRRSMAIRHRMGLC